MLTRFAMTIWRASTDALSYIDDFAKRRTGSGLAYNYWLRLTVAFFGLLPFAIGLAIVAPGIRGFADGQLRVLRDWYPDELVLTLTGGTLSTNVDEPYALDLPAEWGSRGPRDPGHAIVIDTNGSVEDFDSYDAAILLTDTAMVARKDNGLRVFPYAEWDANATIDQATVDAVASGAATYTPALPWIALAGVLLLLLVLPWIGAGVAWLLGLLFLSWATLVVMLAAALMGRRMRYGEAFRLGLFGVTSSVLLSFALGMTGVTVPLLPMLLFFGWMVYVVSRFPRHEPAGPPPAPVKARPTGAAPKRAPAKKAPKKTA